MKPLPGHVFVEPETKPSETETGLILVTEKYQDHNALGVVTELGEGVTDLAVGDRVAYTLAHSTAFKNEGKTFIIVPVKAIFAVVEP